MRIVSLVAPPDDGRLELWPCPEAAGRVERMLNAPGQDGRPLIVLHPGSDWSCQQWQPAHWAAVAETLVRTKNARIVFSGGADDRAFIDETRSQCRAEVLDLSGRTTLGEFIALIDRGDLVVGVDSGAAAIALGVGTPLVVLVGESDPTWQWEPQSEPVRIVRKGDDQIGQDVIDCRYAHVTYTDRCVSPWCMTRGRMGLIQVGDVLEAVEHLLPRPARSA
jgi:ADP-heptose:LPS heptosyltransferase